MKLGLYIHIPFCNKICSYCDFPKVLSQVTDHKNYIDLLIRELYLYKTKYSPYFETIYIGGGTPSVLSISNLEYLFKKLNKDFSQANEITFEANPESLNSEKIKLLKYYGVNRVSLGVQTFDDKLLKIMGRENSCKEVYNCYNNLFSSRIYNINFDFIFGIPFQTIKNLKYDLDMISKFDIKHISYYNMIFESNTIFNIQKNQKIIEPINEELECTMYRYIQNKLKYYGYNQYEISSWCKSDKYSNHNLKYWHYEDYLGIGLGSHSFINNIRFNNTRSISRYIEGKNIDKTIYITKEKQLQEYIFLSLRTLKGINITNINRRFSINFRKRYHNILNKHKILGNISIKNNYICIPSNRLFISNIVMQDF